MRTKRTGIKKEKQNLKRSGAEEELEETVYSQLLFGQLDQTPLEDQGIFFLNEEINKQSVARIINKLVSLQYKLNFNEEVNIYINSPGGELDATWALIDIMLASRLTIRTIALGEIASAATMIFVAGDIRVMSANSGAMIHNYSMGTMGSYSELIALRKWQDNENKKMIKHFINHSKFKTEKEIKENILLDYDNHLTPQEMKKFGLCEEVTPLLKKKKK